MYRTLVSPLLFRCCWNISWTVRKRNCFYLVSNPNNIFWKVCIGYRVLLCFGCLSDLHLSSSLYRVMSSWGLTQLLGKLGFCTTVSALNYVICGSKMGLLTTGRHIWPRHWSRWQPANNKCLLGNFGCRCYYRTSTPSHLATPPSPPTW